MMPRPFPDRSARLLWGKLQLNLTQLLRQPEWDSLSCPQRKQSQYSLNLHQWTVEAVPVRVPPYVRLLPNRGPGKLSNIELQLARRFSSAVLFSNRSARLLR